MNRHELNTKVWTLINDEGSDLTPKEYLEFLENLQYEFRMKAEEVRLQIDHEEDDDDEFEQLLRDTTEE